MTNDQGKTKAQLIEEMAVLQRKVARLKNMGEERRRAEEALRTSEQLHRVTLSAISDAVFITDETGKFTYICPNVATIFGYSWDEVVAMGNIKRLLGEGLYEPEALRETEEIKNVERTARDKGRRKHILLVNVKRVDIQGGTVLITCRDITERRQAEESVLNAIENEQRRIGQDLHDGLIQHLSGTLFMSQLLEKRLAAKGVEETAQAAEITNLITQSVAQTRRLARGLYPIDLETDGLLAVIQQLADSVEEIYGVPCLFLHRRERGPEEEAKPSFEELEVATHLYRIVQEAVNNAVRHAKPSRIEIELEDADGRTVLSIRDDGVGFKMQRGPIGIGLRSMQYRAHLIGAQLKIQRAPEGGTVVICSLKRGGS